MPNGSRERAALDGQCVGIILLLIVNILWVLSAEIVRFIFVNEDFKRPFFTAYVKSVMLIVYMIKYLLCSSEETEPVYRVFENDSDGESFDLGANALNVEGFEMLTCSESSSEDEEEKPKKIRFAPVREIRRLPSTEADEARKARLPYSVSQVDCSFSLSTRMKYTIFLFAPLWVVCSFTYQTSLLFTSVSTLNLISASSSLFVLLFSTCLPSTGSTFTLFKALLVALNMFGVFLVSQFSSSLYGAVLAQVSAVCYAVYLTIYSRYQDNYGQTNTSLVFGTIGVMAIVVGTPLLFVLDASGIEKLYPLPSEEQLASLVISSAFGTLLADYLWLLAVGLTDSLSCSLSMTLSIPLSFLADTVFRHSPPSLLQLLAAIPITVSFIGAALVDRRPSPSPSSHRRSNDEHTTALLQADEDL